MNDAPQSTTDKQKRKPLSDVLQALLYSLAVVAYVVIIAVFMMEGSDIFNNVSMARYGMVAFSLLFTLSAAIVGTLIFGRPAYLFLNGEKKRALYFLASELIFMLFETIMAIMLIAWVFPPDSTYMNL